MTRTTGSAPLYTPDVLALAVSLAQYPFDPAMPYTGESHSRTCGSTIAVSLAANPDGMIERIGLRARACAIGQAAAALFAASVAGRTAESLPQARRDIEQWLTDDSAALPWPGFALLEPARAYPARHGAILLPWTAAEAALGKGAVAG